MDEYLSTSVLNKPKRSVIRLEEFLQDYYYHYTQTNLNYYTYVSYKNALTHFQDICGNKPMNAYKLMDMDTYKSHRKIKQNIRETTINIEMRSIKTAFNYAFRRELIPRCPFFGNGMFFSVQSKRRAFNKKELKALFKVTEGEHIGYIIRLAFYTGMRIGEISQLRWSMVDLEEKFISLPEAITKTKNARTIPLSDPAIEALKFFDEILDEKRIRHSWYYSSKTREECHVIQKIRGWGQYIKRSIGDRFRDAKEAAGIKDKMVTFHSLRHSMATESLLGGARIYEVSKVLGHTTVDITSQFYAHTEGKNFYEPVNILADSFKE